MAARVFSYMWQYTENLRSLYETPTLPPESPETAPNRVRASTIIQAARQAGRSLLTELEAKQLLAAYGLPTVETYLATSQAEALEQAEKIGYPVVLKLHSETITHKTDVGGVR
jgi:acetyltransferase